MANYITTDTELINIANAIREKGGTTEALSYPDGYIAAIEDMQTGGGDTYAVIGVTYPAGSVCTASNGTTTLTAANTSGQAAFSIPTPTSTPETWTISCSDNSTGDNTSMNISISSYGQSFIKELAYVPVPILNNNTWRTISTTAQHGTGDTYWDIGDCKAVTLKGTIGTLALNQTLYVYILDFNHPINKSTADNNIIFGGFKTALTGGKDVCLCDSKYGSSSAGSTKYFNMNHWGSTSSSPYNTNYGGWAACDLRYDILGATERQPSVYGKVKTTSAIGYNATQAAINNPMTNTLMAALPNDMRNVLSLWTRWVDNKGNSSNVDANVTAIIDAGISLLTEFEIFGTRSYANTYEQNHQKQMQYYKAGNSKVKYTHNATSTAAYWWESSAIYNHAYDFCRVSASGSANGNYSSCSHGLAPAFKV